MAYISYENVQRVLNNLDNFGTPPNFSLLIDREDKESISNFQTKIEQYLLNELNEDYDVFYQVQDLDESQGYCAIDGKEIPREEALVLISESIRHTVNLLNSIKMLLYVE